MTGLELDRWIIAQAQGRMARDHDFRLKQNRVLKAQVMRLAAENARLRAQAERWRRWALAEDFHP